MSSNRIYAVSPKVTTEASAPRLIRAGNQSQALRHVAKDTLNVTVASQDDLVAGLTKGVKVEDAAAEVEPQQ
jgi:hypothetical protein